MTRGQLAGFVCLCLWSSAEWITADVLPREYGGAEGKAWRFVIVGLLCLIVGWRKRGGLDGRLLRTALCGVGLIACPYLLLQAGRARAPATTGAICMGLVPVLLLLLLSYTETRPLESALLLACLAGLGGMLLLLPAELPRSAREGFGTGLMLLAAIVSAVSLALLPGLLARQPFLVAVSSICLGSACVLSLAGDWRMRWSFHEVEVESLRALLMDGPEVLLLLSLVRSVAPERLSARYLVAPLFSVLEGYALLRPPLDVRTVLGAGLLAGGAYWLMTAKPEMPITLRV